MLTEYVIEGANFMAVVPVEVDLCGCPYLEAATRALEKAFKTGMISKTDGIKLMVKNHLLPRAGPNLFVWKNGDLGDNKKMHTVKFVDAARNAALDGDFVRWLESI